MERKFEQLGIVSTLVCDSKKYSLFQMGCLKIWLMPAIAHRQIYFAFDENGRPVAYWTWALLAHDVVERLTTDPNALLHESEWNEGGDLWIIDFCAPHGHVKDIVAYMRRSMFPEYEQAFGLHRKEDGTLRKISAWKRMRENHPPTESLFYKLPDWCFANSKTHWNAQKHKMRRHGRLPI